MHRAILCIGSNVVKARQQIEKAVDRLSKSGTRVALKSEIYSVNLPYYNCVAIIYTDMEKCAFIKLTKDIESDMGRTQEMKAKSMVPIDIDVVVFDGLILRPADYSTDYFRLGYSRLENLSVDISKF